MKKLMAVFMCILLGTGCESVTNIKLPLKYDSDDIMIRISACNFTVRNITDESGMTYAIVKWSCPQGFGK